MKRYKVVGSSKVLEREPGEVFSEVIPQPLEAYLLRVGALKILEAVKPKADKGAFKR